MLNNKIEIIEIIDAFIIIFFEARLEFDIPQFFQAASYISRMEKHTQKQQLFHVSKGDEPFFFFQQLVSTVYTVETSFKHQSGCLP